MSKVQLYAVNPEGQTVLLQMSEGSPIKMSLSVAEINPFTPASFFSQTFRLPGIGPNTAFFKDVYSVNGSSFNPAAASEAWILSDGTLFSIGNLNLAGVYTNERTGTIEYEVYFMGDTSNLSSSIGEGGMDTIDASELNHALSYANTTLSWQATGGTAGATAGLFNGNVLYPLCEWGYTYDETTKLPVQATLSNGFAKSFTSATGGIRLDQIKPAFRVKWLFDKILEDAGYTYTSDFLETDYFRSLYFVSDSVARPTFLTSGLCQIVAGEETQSGFPVDTGTTVVIPFRRAVSNIDQAFNTNNFRWTAPSSGDFTFDVFGSAFDSLFLEDGAFRVRAFKNSTEIFDTGILTTLGNSTVTWTYTDTLTLVSGDVIFFTLEHMQFSNPFMVFFNTQFACTAGPDEVVMSGFLPDETILKKIDFIRSIVRMFNLVFEPSKVVQKTFDIEPWVDWSREGRAYDWTRFYDGALDLQSSPVFAEQQRILKFQSQGDEDRLNKQYQDQNKADYWYRQYDSGIKLIRDEQPIDVQFGANPLQSIPSNGTQYPEWVFPTLARLNPGREDQPNSAQMQPILPRPRVYHYNGLQPNPISWYLFDQPSGGTGQAQNSYPLISPYSSWQPDLFDTVNLNFESKEQLWNSTTLVANPVQDLYTNFWEEYVEWIYDPFNRKVSLTLRLDPADILELQFNDAIWIKDTWYFVQKITDYTVGLTDKVKVELVKVPPLAIPGPIPLAATGGTAGTTCQSVSFCNNGTTGLYPSYTYVDCDNFVRSVSVPDLSCGVNLCALVPLVNPLPPDWSVLDNGPCGTTGVQMEIRIISENSTTDSQSVTVSAATGGTAGTYIPLQTYTFLGQSDFFILTPFISANFGLRVGLQTSLPPFSPIVLMEIELGVNGVTGPTVTNNTGDSFPIEATFTNPVNTSDTYTAIVRMIY